MFTTETDGKYQFCDLSDGNYSITVDSTTLPKDLYLRNKIKVVITL